jgi:uncharacterized membrane protein YhaH (DUF805 family)
MNFVNLLFGLQGRVGRRQFWLGLVIIAAVEIALYLVLGVPLSTDASLDRRARILQAIIQLLGLYPLVAIVVKRLHDRNQPTAWAGLIVAVTLVTTVIDLLGLADDPDKMGFGMLVFGLIVLVIGLGFLIELGFRRGTAGPNQYGPEPATTA